MSAPPPTQPKRTPEDRAAEAALTLAKAAAAKRKADAAVQYNEQTEKLLFTKEFNGELEAVMRDQAATVGERFMAWLRRYAWGSWSLFAIGEDGEPKLQADCAKELGVKKSRLSQVVAYYEARGYVRVEGRVLYPVLAPVLGPVPKPDEKSRAWAEFLDNWKVAHSAEFQELEVARSVVKRIRKDALSDYKKFKEQAKKDAASLYRLQDDIQDPRLAKQSTPFEESQKRRPKNETPAQPAQNLSKEGELQFECREYLFREIARMQKSFPETGFSSIPIDAQNPDHQNLVSLILKKLGDYDLDYAMGFVMWVSANFKGLGGNSEMRRRREPGRTGGPNSLGLLVNWAEDYDAAAGPARRAERERIQQQK